MLVGYFPTTPLPKNPSAAPVYHHYRIEHTEVDQKVSVVQRGDIVRRAPGGPSFQWANHIFFYLKMVRRPPFEHCRALRCNFDHKVAGHRFWVCWCDEATFHLSSAFDRDIFPQQQQGVTVSQALEPPDIGIAVLPDKVSVPVKLLNAFGALGTWKSGRSRRCRISKQQVAVWKQVSMADPLVAMPPVYEETFHVYEVRIITPIGSEQRVSCKSSIWCITCQTSHTARPTHLRILCLKFLAVGGPCDPGKRSTYCVIRLTLDGEDDTPASIPLQI